MFQKPGVLDVTQHDADLSRNFSRRDGVRDGDEVGSLARSQARRVEMVFLSSRGKFPATEVSAQALAAPFTRRFQYSSATMKPTQFAVRHWQT